MKSQSASYETSHFSTVNKIDFFSRLMSGLWILILGGFFQIFIGGEITQTAMAVGGAVLFSGKSEIKIVIIILN